MENWNEPAQQGLHLLHLGSRPWPHATCNLHKKLLGLCSLTHKSETAKVLYRSQLMIRINFTYWDYHVGLSSSSTPRRTTPSPSWGPCPLPHETWTTLSGTSVWGSLLHKSELNKVAYRPITLIRTSLTSRDKEPALDTAGGAQHPRQGGLHHHRPGVHVPCLTKRELRYRAHRFEVHFSTKVNSTR